MLHLAGQLRQWIVNGLGGEAPDTRNRAFEFAARGGMSREELRETFRDAVVQSCSVIEHLPAEAIPESRRFQDVERTVAYALVLSVSHMGIHVGQIQHLTRSLVRPTYQETWANPPRT